MLSNNIYFFLNLLHFFNLLLSKVSIFLKAAADCAHALAQSMQLLRVLGSLVLRLHLHLSGLVFFFFFVVVVRFGLFRLIALLLTACLRLDLRLVALLLLLLRLRSHLLLLLFLKK